MEGLGLGYVKVWFVLGVKRLVICESPGGEGDALLSRKPTAPYSSTTLGFTRHFSAVMMASI